MVGHVTPHKLMMERYHLRVFLCLVSFGCTGLGALRMLSGCGQRGPLAAWYGLSAQGAGVVVPLATQRGLSAMGSVVVAHTLSHSVSCGIFLGQGWKLCWQVDS